MRTRAAADARPTIDGKFLTAGGTRFLVKGVSYGTFAPGPGRVQFPSAGQIGADFARMRALGANTVRVYTPPPVELLDEAARHDLRVMIGVPWPQHVAFLDDRQLARRIVADVAGVVRSLSGHPAALAFAIGNEIPPGVVRWHGRRPIERFIRHVYEEAKAGAAAALCTYVNFPPTEFLELSFLDFFAFNVYLHREPELRAYLARLQHLAGTKPLLLSEAGADSIRNGAAGQADLTGMQIRAAFEEGLCGAIAFTWTDEWWRGGGQVEDWAFGLVDRDRRSKPAAAAVQRAFADAPFAPAARAAWPRVSVVVCAHNAAATLADCLAALERLTYPDYEVIVVNDGSRDRTSAVARRHPRVRLIEAPHAGLSVARNVGLAHATGEIVAYTDADARPDCDWLSYLVQPIVGAGAVGAGGPNLVPRDDPFFAQCVARAPGSPTHVLLDDRTAEHVPGVNMAFRRSALEAIGGFDPIFVRAGDDVDVCWRLEERGWAIGFAPSALVWHHHRRSLAAYWRQQVGYGEGERWLAALHPRRFRNGRVRWQGCIYSALPAAIAAGTRINTGVWGTAAFPSIYRVRSDRVRAVAHSAAWLLTSLVLLLCGTVLAVSNGFTLLTAFTLAAGAALLGAAGALSLASALHGDVSGLQHRVRARLVLMLLHILQPLARAFGRFRGRFTGAAPVPAAAPAAGSLRSWWPERRRALLLATGSVVKDEYWAERCVAVEQVLAEVVAHTRRAEPDGVEVEDGWVHDRDLSVRAGPLAWLDLRALIEDHSEQGRPASLLRVAARFRLTVTGGVAAVALAAVSVAAATLQSRWPWTAAAALCGVLTAAIWAVWRAGQIAAAARRRIENAAASLGLTPIPAGAHRRRAPAADRLSDRVPAERS